MPSRDRTAEFCQIADNLRASISTLSSQPVRAPRSKSEFSAQSSEIRKYLNATTAKLERLAKLASSKSLFDDPTQEIEELSFVVKGDIKTLQAKVGQLQSTINAKTSGNKQIENHHKAVMGALQTKLMTTTNGFKEILISRAENMKSQHDRRGEYGRSGGHAGSPSLQQGSEQLFSSPFAPAAVKAPLLGGGGGGGLDFNQSAMDDDDNDECVISVPSMEQLQMVPSNSYASSRAVAAETIQKNLVELGEIFKQLNQMVMSQQEMIQTIDNNVEDTVANVEEAQDMWVKYLENISSNRMLAIKIFSILLFFGLFFIIFLK